MGFEKLSPEKHREISSKGGKTPTTKPRGIGALSIEHRREIALKGVEARRRKNENQV
jgi:hypothetical protein